MVDETKINDAYNEVKYNIEAYANRKGIAYDYKGNVINALDNIFYEGMLEALKFVLEKEN